MTAQTILPANSVVDTGYNVDNSCRFDRASSDDFTKSSSGGSKRKATFSAWLKWGIHVGTSTEQGIFESHDGTNYFSVYTDGKNLRANNTGGTGDAIYSTQVLRDPSAWYHVVIAVDSDQGTASNRFRMYINGSEVTSFSAAVYPTENEDMKFNGSGTIQVGGGAAGNWDGYMAEVVWIDGLQLTPTSFGEFDEDSGIWKPIDVSGLTFGDNGFYLQFKGSGTSANSSGMGADTSGNDNHLTVNNLTAIDQSLDTCTNNHCTQNPIDTDANVVLSEGNLKVSNANNSYYSSCGTLAPVKGRWYFEAKVVSLGVFNVGITKATQDGTVHAQVDAGRVAYSSNGNLYDDSGDPLSDTSTTFGANDIIGVFLDLESGTQAVHFQKNGADVVSRNLADSYSGYTGGFKAAFGMGENDTTSGLINFGAPPFAISSSNSDANGYGDFEYSPVRSSLNYYTLNTKNLAEFG